MAFSGYYAAQIRINLRESEQAEALAATALALSELELQDGARFHVWPPGRAEGKAPTVARPGWFFVARISKR
jgi:hypothetical protein